MLKYLENVFTSETFIARVQGVLIGSLLMGATAYIYNLLGWL